MYYLYSHHVIQQAIGCLGAVRMSEKLLTLYWNLLVVLMFGDAVVGVIWLFRYNVLVTNLQSDLKTKLNSEYGFDPRFQVSISSICYETVFQTIKQTKT